MMNIAYISLFLTSLKLNPLTILVFFVVLALFIFMSIYNYLLVRRIRNRKKETYESGRLMEEALEISKNNVTPATHSEERRGERKEARGTACR